MRLAIIVTEFPKTTETFILRDLMEFHRRGHEIRIYHMTSFRQDEVVHGFARQALEWARPLPYLLGKKVVGAALRALFRRPRAVLRIVGRIIWEYRSEPVWLAKSLFILPKCIAFAEDMRRWPASHVHAEFATHPATCSWVVGRLTGLPYSVSCRAHDIFLTQRMLQVKLGEASFVRTISEFNRRFLTKRVPGLGGKTIAVIHSSVPANRMPALPPPNGEALRIQYIGSLEARKGVDVLLRSLAMARAALGVWECRITGRGPERERLERLCADLGLERSVRFTGALPFERVADAYESAHVVAVPSVIGPGGRTEGIPNVIMEALAHQRPVIASDVSGISELIEDGTTGILVSPGDHGALARALLWVRDNPRDAYRMAVAGRARVLAEFNLSDNARAQLDLFETHRAPGGKGREGRPRCPAPC